MPFRFETTCETILSTDPDAPTQGTGRYSFALVIAPFRQGICRSHKGAGRTTAHANHTHDGERTKDTDWSQFMDRNKQPPTDVNKLLR